MQRPTPFIIALGRHLSMVTPRHNSLRRVWACPRSLATTWGIKEVRCTAHETEVSSVLHQTSVLFSFPLATEMFHFTRCLSYTYGFSARCHDLPSWRVAPFGNPRIKGCLPPPRGLSQAATSFIVFWCQGIHHIPLMRFSHTFDFKVCISMYILYNNAEYLIVKVHSRILWIKNQELRIMGLPP